MDLPARVAHPPGIRRPHHLDAVLVAATTVMIGWVVYAVVVLPLAVLLLAMLDT